MKRLSVLIKSLFISVFLLCPTGVLAEITPFSQAVYTSIENGLAYLRTVQDDNNGHWERTTGLAILAFLDKPITADRHSPRSGFQYLPVTDRERVIEGIRNCIMLREAFLGGAQDAYGTGSCLMAMGRYLATGGTDEVGARVTVSRAIHQALIALLGSQANNGGWSYSGGGTDMSCTHFSQMGVSAVQFNNELVTPEALSRSAEVVTVLKKSDGGHTNYTELLESNSLMTAIAVWVYRLSEVPKSDPDLQSAMAWLHDYIHDPDNCNNPVSLCASAINYYELWSLVKALDTMDDDGEFSGYYRQDFGIRNPAAEGYPEEEAELYFDAALTLINSQLGDGSWSAEPWQSMMAILTLERSYGGSCIGGDFDNDQICLADNCPFLNNPDQSDQDGDGIGDICDPCPNLPFGGYLDQDGDGVGDACDLCPSTPNPEQIDQDLDGIGDACDNCPDTANTDQFDRDFDGAGDVCDCDADAREVCDTYDNDCDGIIDEDPVLDESCETSIPGICSVGTPLCLPSGEISCIPNQRPILELCDGLDNDCDGEIDNMAPQGLCVTDQLGACRAGQIQCVNGLEGCFPINEPQNEVCDGQDNDCDGILDEGDLDPLTLCETGYTGSCSVGRIYCVGGVLGCVPNEQSVDELCNGEDDDCDGLVDEQEPQGNEACLSDQEGVCREGVSRCVEGALLCEALEEPSAEKCDGLDNDCNGLVDDLPNLGFACPTGQSGQCAVGRVECIRGTSFCTPVNQEALEVCDGLDNDCDGDVDEDISNIGASCDTQLSEACTQGNIQCLDGVSLCIAQPTEQPEICDYQDNDCDGQVDEGVRNACGYCGTLPEEVCNGIDDDCDGFIDQGSQCENEGEICVFAGCRKTCEFNDECAETEQCQAGVCLDLCAGMQCNLGEFCQAGICISECTRQDCAGHEECRIGTCVPSVCELGDCPQGWSCQEGTCLLDPCAQVDCGLDELGREMACKRGLCQASCASVVCAEGQVCNNAQCIADPCHNVSCSETEHCFMGECVAPCELCTEGTVCIGRSCQEDPCRFTRCPEHERCQVNSLGHAQCTEDYSPSEETMGGATMGGEMMSEVTAGQEESSGEEAMAGEESSENSLDQGLMSDQDNGLDSAQEQSNEASTDQGCDQSISTAFSLAYSILLCLLLIANLLFRKRLMA